jgi:hypothetical protein
LIVREGENASGCFNGPSLSRATTARHAIADLRMPVVAGGYYRNISDDRTIEAHMTQKTTIAIAVTSTVLDCNKTKSRNAHESFACRG